MAGAKADKHNTGKAGTPGKGKPANSILWQLSIVGFVFASLAPLTIWFFFMREPGPTLDERLSKAEEAVAKGEDHEAKRQILLLKEAKYVEENYGGKLEYLIGITSFRDAEKMDRSTAMVKYRSAVSYLRAAEKKSLPAIYLPDKTYALGISLYRLGLIREAVPILQIAWEICKEEQGQVGLILAECEMNPNIELHEEQLEGHKSSVSRYLSPLNKNEIALHTKNLTDEERTMGLLQRVDLFLKLGESKKAREAFEEAENYFQNIMLTNPTFTLDNSELVLLRGKILSSEEKYQQAIDLLIPYIQYSNANENPVLRQAMLIIGECYERLGNVDQAVAHYKRCASLEEADEMIPACLKIADLLRNEKDQHEQSYEQYLTVLKYALDESTFNNHLISWGDIRTEIRSAWKDWVSSNQYRWALKLSERLTPLFSQDDAYEMSALVSKSWAESLQQQYDNALFNQREILFPQVVDRWNQAGMAFSLLAKSRVSMASYPDALWNATLMFRKGNDYENALKNVDLFLETQPRGLLPTALVLRGEILMDLQSKPPHDTLDQAVSVFQQVIDEHPRDTASFRAQVNLGKAYLEKDNPEIAQAIWKKMLSQPELSPDAFEWRQAQYLLAKTWVNHVEQLFYNIRQEAKLTPQKAKDYENLAYSQLESSVRTLREFLLREKEPTLVLEAKDILATALHKLAQRAVNQLPTAETDNLKNELIGEIQTTLKEVISLYKEIKTSLQVGSAAKFLNSQEQMILKNAYFKSGHLLFELAQYDESMDYFTASIMNYRDAVNYFPQDPQVLLAYYQMSNCYQRLGQDRQAKSYLEQARIILIQIPDHQFNTKQTNFTKEEWQRLLDQSLQLHETKTAVN